MASINAHELRSVNSRQSTVDSGSEVRAASRQDPSAEIEMRSLPPTDHGKQAYLVLAGCTLIQAPVWGAQML